MRKDAQLLQVAEDIVHVFIIP